jgi:branched-subunit amino acid aminotransferase/4-amino-4-deoxychorismate lyase
VSLRDPVHRPKSPQRLLVVEHERPFAHLKHVGSFAQNAFAREAERAGYDDALFVRDGWIRETTVANIGFAIEGEIVWPAGPVLAGVTMQLLQSALSDSGVGTTTRPAQLAELSRVDGAFLANSTGIAAVSAIGDVELAVDDPLMALLESAYERTPWDQI